MRERDAGARSAFCPTPPVMSARDVHPPAPGESRDKAQRFQGYAHHRLSHFDPGNALLPAMCDIGLTHAHTALCVAFPAELVTVPQKQCPKIDAHKSRPFRYLRACASQNGTKCLTFGGLWHLSSFCYTRGGGERHRHGGIKARRHEGTEARRVEPTDSGALTNWGVSRQWFNPRKAKDQEPRTRDHSAFSNPHSAMRDVWA
jgi:hypothetical protein